MTIIEDVGESVTVTEVTRTIDEYGDESESTSNSSVNAVIELMSSDEEIVKSGILNVGDAIGYFDPNDNSVLSPGNRVTHNSITYVITAVDKYGIGGTAMQTEVQMKRIAPQ